MGEIADDHIGYMTGQRYAPRVGCVGVLHSYCRHCGKTIRLIETLGGWRPFNEDRSRHTCLTTKDMTTEGFDDVD